MADSGATRQARYKRHKSGDHSLCRHHRPMVVLPAMTAPATGEIEPEAEMRLLAARLAEAHRQDPANALLARELRITLLTIPPEPEGPDAIDMLNMRRATRRRDADIEDLFHELGT
jgi:hypothetical protein